MIHFELFLTRYAGGTWLSWEPQAISFFGLGSGDKYLGQNHLILPQWGFVLRSKFQSSCTLLGREQRFSLPSQRSPTFVYHKPPDGVFPPKWPLLANCCESCLVEFPLLYLALFRILLAASLRIFGLPVLFLSSNPSFLDDHFTTQRSDFFSFLEISLTDKPVDQSIDAWALK